MVPPANRDLGNVPAQGWLGDTPTQRARAAGAQRVALRRPRSRGGGVGGTAMSRGGGVTGTAASPSPRAMLGPLLPRTALGRSGPGPPARSAPSLGSRLSGDSPDRLAELVPQRSLSPALRHLPHGARPALSAWMPCPHPSVPDCRSVRPGLGAVAGGHRTSESMAGCWPSEAGAAGGEAAGA